MERTISDPPRLASGDGIDIEKHKVNDDMASRRSGGHIPAPLRKKRMDEMYKQFITPTGNPVKYLEKHNRSRSMSDLDQNDRQDTEAINKRYSEMEKLKDMLKEEEATWTSKLQSWKTRRRSVTEDARKRKEQREDLEKNREINENRRKSKTYKEIVEEKRKRDQELSLLGDENKDLKSTYPISPTSNSEYFSNNSDNSSTSPSNMYTINLSKNRNVHASKTGSPSETIPVIDNRQRSSQPHDTHETHVVMQPLKYTSKVTAVINHVRVPSNQSKSSGDESPRDSSSPASATMNYNSYRARPSLQSNPSVSSTKKSSTLPRTQASIVEAPVKMRSTSTVYTSPPTTATTVHKSNIPKVILRNKNNNSQKERPKSAYSSRDLEKNDWSKSLPRSYKDYSTPRPFVAGQTTFSKYRKTNFASKRSIFENMGKDDNTKPTPLNNSFSSSTYQARSVENLYEGDKMSKTQPKNVLKRIEPVLSKTANSSTISANNENNKQMPVKGNVSAIMASFKEAQAPKQRSNEPPPKLPLVDSPRISEPESEVTKSEAKNVTATATLTPRGLSITSARSNKTVPQNDNVSVPNALFHDMKICINQRPRSEKGFGFTVRGGDNGKPVIVDTVSSGGAADICQLCVGDEIVAINDVPLADCHSQDDIVQLIVGSVITGNLSLDIRRYGKPKKVSPLRLSGTKVVMTPGGFVQVRSDKANGTSTLPKSAPHNANFQHTFNLNNSSTDANNNLEDLPPPPSKSELQAVSNSNKAATLPSRMGQRSYMRPTSPLSGMIQAAKNVDRFSPTESDSQNYRYNSRPNSGRSGGTSHSSISEVYSSNNVDSDEEQLRNEILQAQKALATESSYAEMERKRLEEDRQLKLQLLEEQKRLELEEKKREEERQLLVEEARLEDLRVEEELRKIEAHKLERRREYEKNRINAVDSKPSAHINGSGLLGMSQSGDVPHWLIEEAERRRLAENDGKYRSNPLNFMGHSDFQNGEQDMRNSYLHNNPPAHIWNDPSAQATLL